MIRVLQILLALVWLGITVLAVLDEGTLSFRFPFIIVSFALGAVMFCEYQDKDER